ncbi:MAG: SsrA-binding protein SmpB [Magnetococcales bacterium]|nr:SsrA-binding protein SmpB [Magnetococcales bacterium]
MSIKIITKNRKARYNYEIIEKIEAGVQLYGTEVKSIRTGRMSVNEAYAVVTRNELFLLNANIPEYNFGNINNHDAFRSRKLLVHKGELRRLIGITKEKGMALIPMAVYWKGPWVKVEVGIGKGKKLFDKRQSTKDREWGREKQRLMKQDFS